MRAALLTVVVLGFAVLGDAQTAQAPAGVSKARFDSLRYADGLYQMRGGVELEMLGGTMIKADEADFNGTTREMALRGNVRLQLPPVR